MVLLESYQNFRGLKKLMLAIERNIKWGNVIHIPYSALTIKEAIYLLTNYHDGYFDAGKQSVIVNEDED